VCAPRSRVVCVSLARACVRWGPPPPDPPLPCLNQHNPLCTMAPRGRTQHPPLPCVVTWGLCCRGARSPRAPKRVHALPSPVKFCTPPPPHKSVASHSVGPPAPHCPFTIGHAVACFCVASVVLQAEGRKAGSSSAVSAGGGGPGGSYGFRCVGHTAAHATRLLLVYSVHGDPSCAPHI
jgi:hypothetical protein